MALSRWLLTKPTLLILDEPTQGIDVGAKSEIHELMMELAAQGVAILMISSELPEILGMSDRIAVMHGGDDRRRARSRRGDAGARAGARARAADERVQGARRGGGRRLMSSALALLGRHKRELPPAVALAAVLLAVLVAAPSFFGAANLRDLALNNAPVLLVAIGMTLVILVGEIDISVGSQFAVCSVAAGVLAKAGVPIALVPIVVLAVGAAMGAVNGFLVGTLGLPSIIVTLAMLVAWRDALRWATEGAWVQDLPANFQWFGLAPAAAQALIVVVALVVLAAFGWALRNLQIGRDALRRRLGRGGGAARRHRAEARRVRRVHRDGRARRARGDAQRGPLRRGAEQRGARARAAGGGGGRRRRHGDHGRARHRARHADRRAAARARSAPR